MLKADLKNAIYIVIKIASTKKAFELSKAFNIEIEMFNL